MPDFLARDVRKIEHKIPQNQTYHAEHDQDDIANEGSTGVCEVAQSYKFEDLLELLRSFFNRIGNDVSAQDCIENNNTVVCTLSAFKRVDSGKNERNQKLKHHKDYQKSYGPDIQLHVSFYYCCNLIKQYFPLTR